MSAATSLLAPEPEFDTCVLAHRVFRSLGPVLFRRSESDGVPVMVLTLGEREAAVPLRSLQRELGIEGDSPDGRMFALIAQSMDYVSGLVPGDRLPAEVIDGKASWEPDPRHRRVAAGRLRMRLLAWLDPQKRPRSLPDADVLGRLDEDRMLRHQVQKAFEEAAKALGLASAEEVVGLVQELAEELAYIEALRETLLAPATSIAASLERLWRTGRGDSDRQETLGQVSRLASIAMRGIGARFQEVDAKCDNVMGALRDADGQRDFIRASRDWLYRTRRAWDPIICEWAAVQDGASDTSWTLISRTYQFLAPRYMAVQEWQSVHGARGAAKPRPIGAVMHW